jgi:hypothetical protein
VEHDENIIALKQSRFNGRFYIELCFNSFPLHAYTAEMTVSSMPDVSTSRILFTHGGYIDRHAGIIWQSLAVVNTREY